VKWEGYDESESTWERIDNLSIIRDEEDVGLVLQYIHTNEEVIKKIRVQTITI